ncbi:MAG: SCO family protein [Polyangiaceae bacterium]
MNVTARRRLFYVLLVAVILAAVGELGFSLSRHRSQISGMPAIRAAPQYVLVNQLGQSVNSTAFDGKVQIVAFLFPYCKEYCPLIAAELVRFNRDLQGTDLANRVQFVAFNVDPAGSGAPQLRAFMNEYGWNPRDTRWQFLTGSPQAIHHVVTDGYMVYYAKESLAQEAREEAQERAKGGHVAEPRVQNKLADKAHVDYDVVHNDILELVGPDGQIRKIYDDGEKVPEKDLFADVRTLAAQK